MTWIRVSLVLASALALACGGSADGASTTSAGAAPPIDPDQPCDLLSVAAVDQALGGEVTVAGEPEASPTQCIYRLSDGSGSIQLYVFADKGLYEFHRDAVAGTPGAEPLSGLGDEALGGSGEAFVGWGGKKGVRVLSFSMGGVLDESALARVAIALARSIAAG